MPLEQENKFIALGGSALAGCLATVPMTFAMELGHRFLPSHEKYPLPPREITDDLIDRAGLSKEVEPKSKFQLTMLSHFAYGTACGLLYFPLRHLKINPILKGCTYGFAVWAASYLGHLPALKILKPANQHPPERNALMIAAHFVWGISNSFLQKIDLLHQRS